MMNIQIQGTVRRKSTLSESKNGKYFSFCLYDSDNHSLRVVAFKLAAEKLYNTFENDKTYQISKVSVRENRFKDNVELQVALTTDVTVTFIHSEVVSSIAYTPLSTLNTLPNKTAVDVIGRIVDVNLTERIMKDGAVKTVAIVTIMDHEVHVDITFWEHINVITDIPPDDCSLTVISIVGATVNCYQNAITLNVGKSATIALNPTNEAANTLLTIDQHAFSMNLSQRSESSTQNDLPYSNETIICAIKRELESIEEKQQRLKI